LNNRVILHVEVLAQSQTRADAVNEPHSAALRVSDIGLQEVECVEEHPRPIAPLA
jgi:hypothetical protein